jgi:hypothetical protein
MPVQVPDLLSTVKSFSYRLLHFVPNGYRVIGSALDFASRILSQSLAVVVQTSCEYPSHMYHPIKFNDGGTTAEPRSAANMQLGHIASRQLVKGLLDFKCSDR